MKAYQAGSIRNICLLSHGGVGKTTLMEALCYTTKATSKIGKVDNGSSTFDSRTDEKHHKMTIAMHLGFCEWNSTKINVLDTPGFLDFLGDTRAALRVVETAVILIDAHSGVQVGTEMVSSLVDQVQTPRVFFVNGMDKENVVFDETLEKIRTVYGASVAPLVIPIGSGTSFSGVIDLVKREAYKYVREGNGIGEKIAIPESMIQTVDTIRQALMETVAETDETLMNSYFEHGELTDAELRDGLSRGVAAGTIYPLTAGSALLNIGIDQFLTNIVNLCPAADSRKETTAYENSTEVKIAGSESAPMSAFVFKTISEEHLGEINCVRVFSGKMTIGSDAANVGRAGVERLGNMYYIRGKERTDTNEIVFGDMGGILKLKDTHTNDTLADKGVKHVFPKIDMPEPLVSVAIAPKVKGEEDKISVGIAKLHEEDICFSYKFHSDVHQSILSGMGEMQIDVVLENLKNRFKVEIEKKPPKISYRETITKAVKYIEYTHKKQSGGAGQYARVFIDLEPLKRGDGYEFVDKIVGGVIDQSLRPSVDKGVHSKLEEGILAGYPIVDIRVSLVDGKTHPVDSKDIAFQIAGREVFKKAFEMASPILLEPVVDLKVTVPEEFTGDIMGDLSSRRGKISGMDLSGKHQVINAKIPEAEIQTYSSTLRSLTQGRGFYSKKFSHYEPVPGELTKKIVELSKVEHTA